MLELAFEDISIIINQPQWLMIHGEDSSRLKKILDFLHGRGFPTDGEYLFKGKSLNTYSPRELAAFRKSEAINISEANFLMEDATIVKNLQSQLKFSGIYPSKGKRIIDGVIREMNLANIKDEVILNLSPYEIMLVRLAKALVVEPKLICGFSPFKELAEEEGKAVGEIVYRLVRRGIAIVMVTDDLNELELAEISQVLK